MALLCCYLAFSGLAPEEARALLDDLASRCTRGCRTPGQLAGELRTFKVSAKTVLRKWAISALMANYFKVGDRRRRYFLCLPEPILATLPQRVIQQGFNRIADVKKYLVREVLGLSVEDVPAIAENNFTVQRAFLILDALYNLSPSGFSMPVMLKWLDADGMAQ